MFEGGGFGVGLTVTPLAFEWPAEAAPPAEFAELSPPRLTELMPVAARSDAELAVELGRVQQAKAMLAAYEAALVMGFAAHRPEAADPAPGKPGGRVHGASPIPGASEFFVDELAAVTNSSSKAAARLAAESWVLIERLPGVWTALADGAVDRPRAQVFIDVLGSTATGVPEKVVPKVLPQAAGLSMGRLRAALTRELLAVDAAAAEERRAEAEAAADVRLYPTADGMAELAAELPAPLAAACWSTVDQLAWLAKHDGDPRPLGVLRGAVLGDLILRPWDTSRPPVTAHLDVLAPLPTLIPAPGEQTAEPAWQGEPAEVNGQPITAAHVRELLAQLDAVCPGGLQAPAGGSLQVTVTDPAAGTLLATAGRTQLARIAARGCPTHPEPDDSPGTDGCGCAVLGRPAAVDRYTPSPAQRRFVTRRDRTCRHPHCGQPVGRVDLDHVEPYPGGPTGCDNLCCLCRRHHRLKTHAPGWRFELRPDGTLRVTTPSGITRTTRPPGLRDRLEQRALPAPPRPPAPPGQPPPQPPVDDPPPF